MRSRTLKCELCNGRTYRDGRKPKTVTRGLEGTANEKRQLFTPLSRACTANARYFCQKEEGFRPPRVKPLLD